MNASFNIKVLHVALAARTSEVATALLGEPNPRLSSKQELRFGRQGSLAVVIAGARTGSWFDHENGVGGNLFSLIRSRIGGGFLDAVEVPGCGLAACPGHSHGSESVRCPAQRALLHCLCPGNAADRHRPLLSPILRAGRFPGPSGRSPAMFLRPQGNRLQFTCL